MKNFKRIAAILGVVILLAVCCLPMIFAFGSGENSQGNFKAAVGSVILVPVLAYVFLMVYKLLKKEEKEVAGEVKNIIFDVGQVLISYDWEVCVMILFRHAQIYDGTGQKPFLGDVLSCANN